MSICTPCTTARMDLHEVLKPFRTPQSEWDDFAGREIKKLVADLGALSIPSRPANYFESHRLITKHLDMWDGACGRLLRRLERLAHLEEEGTHDVLIKNEVRLVREGLRYLIYATGRLSFHIYFRHYRPVKKHETRYFRWLETKIKFDGFTAKESVMFWSGFLHYGDILLALSKDRVYLAFYYPHGEAPLGLKRAIIMSLAKGPNCRRSRSLAASSPQLGIHTEVASVETNAETKTITCGKCGKADLIIYPYRGKDYCHDCFRPIAEIAREAEDKYFGPAKDNDYAFYPHADNETRDAIIKWVMADVFISVKKPDWAYAWLKCGFIHPDLLDWWHRPRGEVPLTGKPRRRFSKEELSLWTQATADYREWIASKRSIFESLSVGICKRTREGQQ